MNSYEEKKQRRIDYYNEKAEKFEQQSSQLAHESSKMVEAIPMGQPLLVDHHSYKSDKNANNFYPFSGSPHKHWLYHQRHSEVSVFFCPFSVKLCTLCIR